MSKKDKIKKLKEKIEELEFVKDFQQDIIADMELITGVDMAKKWLPKTLAEEIEKKKQNRSKENGLIQCFGISKQAFYKRLKTYNSKQYQKSII